MTTSQSAARPFDVAVECVANIDLCYPYTAPALPRDGETEFGTELETRAGGKDLNQEVAVANHGSMATIRQLLPTLDSPIQGLLVSPDETQLRLRTQTG